MPNSSATRRKPSRRNGCRKSGRKRTPKQKYWFDEAAADKAVKFFETYLIHTKGKWAGQPFILEDWEKDEVIRPFFGWKRQDGTRRYRTLFVFVPKKNGKSSLGSGLALYLTYADNEPSAEVYCLHPNTRILCEDLSWRPIKNLEIGDRLLGFDEYPPEFGKRRRMRETVIEKKHYLSIPAFEIKFTTGEKVVCSANHRWLARAPIGGTLNWKMAKNLSRGWRIRYFGMPWEKDNSREAGYLAGLFDGEGYFHAPLVNRSGFRIGFAQKPGVVLDEGLKLLDEKGFNPKPPKKQSRSSAWYSQINGIYECLRFLGQIKPLRLYARRKEQWVGKAPNFVNGYLKIASIKYIGRKKLVDIQTSTKTFIAEGLFSHNSAAGDIDQAAIVFNAAKDMVLASRPLLARGQPFKKSIVVRRTGSVYRVISSDAYTKEGYNVSGCVFDELHVQPNRDLWDILNSNTAARRQPAVIALTTAGFDKNTICGEVYDYAKKVLNGIIKDDTFLAVIYEADKDDDWRDPKVWRKANPNMGVTFSEENIARDAAKAEAIPAYENTFRRVRLNQWTSQKSRWIPLRAWDDSAGEVDPLELEGLPCYAGLDLSSTTDLTALLLIFPVDDGYKLLPYFWIPEDNMRERMRRDKVPYDVWIRQGFIDATEGNVIDYNAILKKLGTLRDKFSILEIAYDRWGATKVVQELEEMDFKVVPFGQGFVSMSPPAKEFLRLVLSKKMHHGGNPVMRWMVDNASVKTDPADNIKVVKNKGPERVDGVVAAIMALDRAVRNEKAPSGKSVYEDRGMLEVEL